MGYRAWLLGAVCGLSLIAQADDMASPPKNPVALETVTVTAEKRVESVQRTPISIEAFDRKRLDLLGIESVADLASNVPAMTVQPFPTNNSQLVLFIRGIGIIDAQVTQDPSIGVYVDGIYIARSAGLALDITDLQRVEVLRGPQGTLYGRNATGGAINLITKRPTIDEVHAAASFGYGSRNELISKARLNLPLGDTLAMKLAVLGKSADGFVENTGLGGDFGDRHSKGFRYEARWLPADWFTADYAFDLSDLRSYNSSYQAVLPARHSHGQADLISAYAESQTIYSDQRLRSLATGAPLERSGTHVRGHALTLSVPLDAFELKYIGAYRNLRDAFYSDLGGGAGSTGYRLDTNAYDGPSAQMAYGGPTPLTIPTLFQHQWSHELEFGGQLFDKTVDFVSGAYYFSEDGGENGQPLHHVLNSVIDPSNDPSLPMRLPGVASAIFDLAGPQLVEYWKYLYLIHNTAEALYGQATWSPEFLSRRLHLTAGARYSQDHRDATKNFVSDSYVEGRQNGVPVAVALPATQGADTFDNVRATKDYSDFSPSFNLQYDINARATAYLSSAKAYKSGGFNVRDPQISAASGAASDGTNYGVGFTDGFRPEHVHAYELGLKSEWFGRRLRINADVFDTDYRDEQINFLIPGTVGDTKTLNAGHARIRGFENSTTWLVAPGLLASLNYAYLEAKTLEVLDITGNNVAAQYPFQSAPRHSGNASLDWTFLRSARGNLRAFVNYTYQGRQAGSSSLPDDQLDANIGSQGLLDAQLGANAIRIDNDNRLDINLWGRNLLDRQYVTTVITELPQADRAVLFGEPRSVGLSLGYRFR